MMLYVCALQSCYCKVGRALNQPLLGINRAGSWQLAPGQYIFHVQIATVGVSRPILLKRPDPALLEQEILDMVETQKRR